jgi:UDP-2,3-diacylglucosamine pyrophosphatase LpxH
MNSVDCEPIHLQQLMDWLIELKGKGGYSVKLGKWGPAEKKLVFPEKLILLGDIFELWDASDRAIGLCSSSILNSMLKLDCEKVYVIGNHDFAMIEHPGFYPFGPSPLNIVKDTYPEQAPSQDKVLTLEIGEKHYLFLHGHQFDKTFRSTGKLWIVMSLIRDGAEAFGLYSWLLILMLIIFWLLARIGWNASYTPPITVVLAILAFPKLFTSIARPLWNKLKKTRYKRKKALNGFLDWWRSWTECKGYPKGIRIVYGHTHLADIIEPQRYRAITGRELLTEGRGGLELINIPAWVKDYAEKYRNVLRAVFLYIDSEDYWFIGWDWEAKRPFYIPKEVVKLIGEGGKLPKEMAKDLREIDWPEGLLNKWVKK